MPLRIGHILQKRYRITKKIGEGGMSTVYRATDKRLNIPVAIKELKVIPLTDIKQLHQRFEQEALVLAKLKHPNLVEVTDYFRENDNGYIVMEFVEGRSLDDIIMQKGKLSEAQVLKWGIQLLDALNYFHQQGIIHRDIKPQNIIINSTDQAVLVDFGLHKFTNSITSAVIEGYGTPNYASPEQYSFIEQQTDARSDIYSLGATLYYAITGEEPPSATDRIQDGDITRYIQVSNSTISTNTMRVISKAMSLSPSQRFKNAEEMAKSLRPGVNLQDYGVKKRNKIQNSIKSFPIPVFLFILVCLIVILTTVPDLSRSNLTPTDSPTPIITFTPKTTISPSPTSKPIATAELLPTSTPMGPAIRINNVGRIIQHEVFTNSNSISDFSIGELNGRIIAGVSTSAYILSTPGLKAERFLPQDTFVNAITINEENTLSAIGNQNGNITIYDINEEQRISTISVHEGRINDINFIPNSHLVASAGEDGLISIQDINDKTIHYQLAENTAILSIDVCASQLIFGTKDGRVENLNLDNLNLSYSLAIESRPIYDIVFNNDCTNVVIASSDIKILDVENGTVLRVLKGHQGEVYTLDFNMEGDVLASGSSDGTVRLWDPILGVTSRLLFGHSGEIKKVRFGTLDRNLISLGSENKIIVWLIP